jgi:hypothetical protein
MQSIRTASMYRPRYAASSICRSDTSASTRPGRSRAESKKSNVRAVPVVSMRAWVRLGQFSAPSVLVRLRPLPGLLVGTRYLHQEAPGMQRPADRTERLRGSGSQPGRATCVRKRNLPPVLRARLMQSVPPCGEGVSLGHDQPCHNCAGPARVTRSSCRSAGAD